MIFFPLQMFSNVFDQDDAPIDFKILVENLFVIDKKDLCISRWYFLGFISQGVVYLGKSGKRFLKDKHFWTLFDIFSM